MEYAQLGRSEVRISRIGFGCEQLGETDWGDVDPRSVVNAVRRALELGITFFDTADVYGLGASERVLASALGDDRHAVVIATRFGVNWKSGPNGGRAKTYFDCSPNRLEDALEGSLRRLRIERIPLYLVHWPDPGTPLEATMNALAKAHRAGKIGEIGVSNFPVNLVRAANEMLRLSAVEVQYNLLDRTVEKDLVNCCQDLGLSLLAYGPLAQGLLTGKYRTNGGFKPTDRRSRLQHFQGPKWEKNLEATDRVCEVAARLKYKSSSQVALRWLLDNPTVTSVITGVKTASQIEENVGALGWTLSREQRTYLEKMAP